MSPPSAVRELLPFRKEEKAGQGKGTTFCCFGFLFSLLVPAGLRLLSFHSFSFLFFIVFLFLLWDSESPTPLSRSLLAWFASNFPLLYHFNRFFDLTLALPGRTIGFKI